jgi:hypothetical protein
MAGSSSKSPTPTLQAKANQVVKIDQEIRTEQTPPAFALFFEVLISTRLIPLLTLPVTAFDLLCFEIRDQQ